MISQQEMEILTSLSNTIRRDIVDCLLRHGGSLTLTDLARELSMAEQAVYYHLQQLMKSGVLKKEDVKVDGKRITLYCVTNMAKDVLESRNKKPDLTPIYALGIVYTALMILATSNPAILLRLLNKIGIESQIQLLQLCVIGLATTAIPGIYYTLRG